MGLLFIIGYILVLFGLLSYLISSKIRKEKKEKEESSLKALGIAFVFTGIFYVFLAVMQGDPNDVATTTLGIILSAFFYFIAKDIYNWLKMAYKTISKLQEGCPLLRKKQ